MKCIHSSIWCVWCLYGRDNLRRGQYCLHISSGNIALSSLDAFFLWSWIESGLTSVTRWSKEFLRHAFRAQNHLLQKKKDYLWMIHLLACFSIHPFVSPCASIFTENIHPCSCPTGAPTFHKHTCTHTHSRTHTHLSVLCRPRRLGEERSQTEQSEQRHPDKLNRLSIRHTLLSSFSSLLFSSPPSLSLSSLLLTFTFHTPTLLSQSVSP